MSQSNFYQVVEKSCLQAGQKDLRGEASTLAQPSGAQKIDPSTSLRTGCVEAYLGGTLERLRLERE